MDVIEGELEGLVRALAMDAARLCHDLARHRFCAVGAAGVGRDDPYRRDRAGGRRGQGSGRRRLDPGLSRDAGQGRTLSDRARRPGDLRRARAHQGHRAGASPSSAITRSRPSSTPARAIRAEISDIKELIAKIVSKVPDDQVMSDLDATAGLRQGDPARPISRKLAVTGFCWGGRITWLYAAHKPELKAAVAWYGPIDRPRTELTAEIPDRPVPDLKCPVLGLYGGADKSIPRRTRSISAKRHARPPARPAT